ncbi:MAG: GH92 family glycosyl hydrolase [Crocinitomicaceae bacterium]
MRYLKLLAFLCLSVAVYGQTEQPAKLVNPFIGTGGHGHTYPGVSAPFGMMQLSPDTRLDGWDGCGGYHYSDSILYGFSHTHLSGTGVSDYGDLLILPFIGENRWNQNDNGSNQGYGARFDHETEQAHAGYYSVLLKEQYINVQLTTTTRCGFHQYEYPRWEKKKVIIDLTHRDQLLGSDLILINDSTLIGKRISNAWATEQHFYFTIQFSEAVSKTEIRKTSEGMPAKMILQFGHVNPILKVKVGISAVDIDGAKKNLLAEMPDWNFSEYLVDAEQNWNESLNDIEVYSRSSRQKSIFYTALYHAYLNPNTFSDVDGRYRGMDQKIHNAKGRNQYTIFSLWDTFRATHPLFTITQRKRTLEFIQTFLAQYKQGGILPIWELSANYTGCMIGYHAIPVIVDAYVKEIREFDTELALKAMCHSADQNHLGLGAYKKRGYISSEDESESVSKTLEYAYDDWCIAIFAETIGKDSIAKVYFKRAQHYKNLFHPDSKFMQPRYNGSWKSRFLPEEVTFDYTEANSWQYSLFVPQDTDGLIEMLGGRDSLEAWLDRLFSVSSETSGRHQVDITGLIGQYAHGNEPSHHMAYMYNFTKSNWKGQQYIHQILRQLYSDKPDGLSGNEDCGQMSAWYVLSSMGFYSYAPGSPDYLTGSPLFDSVRINLENGKEFLIKRSNYAVGNDYVKSISLNGEKVDRNYITHEEIMKGGELEFIMTPERVKYEGRHPKSSIEQPFIASPFFTESNPSFDTKTKIGIDHPSGESVTIRYTTDGSEPSIKSKKYKKPIKLKKGTTIRAVAMNGLTVSYPIEGRFIRSNTKWEIELLSEFANQYAAGGERALIDQIKGGDDFRTGPWQGYWDTDLSFVIDFQKEETITALKMRFLQDIRSWIWLPSELRIMISTDREKWFTVNTLLHKIPIDKYGALIHEFEYQETFKTQYLKIEAINRGECPSWHLGAGNPTWIFADEIEFKFK